MRRQNLRLLSQMRSVCSAVHDAVSFKTSMVSDRQLTLEQLFGVQRALSAAVYRETRLRSTVHKMLEVLEDERSDKRGSSVSSGGCQKSDMSGERKSDFSQMVSGFDSTLSCTANAAHATVQANL